METKVEPVEQLEAWLNAGKSRVFINRVDMKGGVRQELIGGGRTFHLSTAERRMNQDMAADPKFDLFSNGVLQPIRLLEGTEDAEALTSNPNLLREGESEGIFKLHWRTFEKRIAEVSNVVTLERILELAEEHDATVRQVGIVKTRLAEIAPSPADTQPESGVGPAPGMAAIHPVTPR